MPGPSDFAHDDWPVAQQEGDDTHYIGTTDADVPMVYNATEHTLFGVSVDQEAEKLDPVADTVQELTPEESVGDAIERLGEELGWSSLSSFGESRQEA